MKKQDIRFPGSDGLEMKKTEIPPRKEIMAMWDAWRDYIASGGRGSWPRDAFESILDAYEEQMISCERVDLKPL
ncbi:MAG: hypothetical protein DRP56_03805 [Planctomycetota bacterium]|nr:MAG: hypothetical protein DRP56_03805 [Planctomycetota bacterium]